MDTPPETGSSPNGVDPRTAEGADAVAADGPDGDGLVDDEGPDGLLDPDDDTGHGFDPVAPWPEDNDDSGGGDRWSDPSQNTPDNPGHDGEDPEDDTDDDGWDDDLGPGRYPPPYTGLGLWDAHKEAELW